MISYKNKNRGTKNHNYGTKQGINQLLEQV